ncbi:hypothetical protein KI387_042042, partial [Taxus chinensis]
SASMPSPPSSLPSKVVHYYADTLAWEDHYANQIDATNSDTHGLDKGNFEVDDFLATQENQEVNYTQDENNQAYKPVSRFLKLPIEKVHTRVKINDDVIRIGRQSQILTSDDYLHLLQEQETRKREIEDLKAKKREHTDERKVQ